MAITFQTENTDLKLQNKKLLKNWIKQVITSFGYRVGDIAYLFTDDEKILKINREYLNHDYFTDIITFDYSTEGVIEGDIVISVDTVKSNSIELNTDFYEELYRVIIHGILHMVGFDDKTDEQKEKMRQEETKAINILLRDGR